MHKAFAPILAKHGLSEKADLTAKYIQCEMMVERRGYKPYREILADASRMLFKQEYGVDLDEQEAAALVKSVGSWEPFPDAAAALQKLKKRYRLAVLSNIDDDMLAASMQRLGVEFDATVTAEQIKSYKPVNTHWKEAMERFGVTEEQMFHVAGSYLHDVMPAKQLGIACAWINRKAEKPFVTTRPDAEFADLSQLPEFLGA